VRELLFRQGVRASVGGCLLGSRSGGVDEFGLAMKWWCGVGL
jgi:hypothetical protein